MSMICPKPSSDAFEHQAAQRHQDDQRQVDQRVAQRQAEAGQHALGFWSMAARKGARRNGRKEALALRAALR